MPNLKKPFPTDRHSAALLCAQIYYDPEMEKALMKAVKDVNAEVEAGNTVLHLATRKKILPLVTILLECDVDVNAENDRGHTALMTAAETGFDDAVSLLIEHCADIEHVSRVDLHSSLMLAVINGHLTTAEILLKAGAEIEGRGFYGDTPLMLSVLHDNAEMARLLLVDHGADPHARNLQGTTPYYRAQLGDKTAICMIFSAFNENYGA